MRTTKIACSTLFLAILSYYNVYAQVPADSKMNLDSCQITKYTLSGLQTVYGRLGLKIADGKDTISEDLHHLEYSYYFRLDVEKLFEVIANVFSEGRIKDLSKKNCHITPYMYFNALGVNLENYFFMNKGQTFKPEEICAMDTAIKKSISGWFAKPGYTEWFLKRRWYLLLHYSFTFRDLLIYRTDGKTLPRGIREIPENLRIRPPVNKD